MARLRVRIVHQVVNWCEPIVPVANYALSPKHCHPNPKRVIQAHGLV